MVMESEVVVLKRFVEEEQVDVIPTVLSTREVSIYEKGTTLDQATVLVPKVVGRSSY